MAGVVELNGDTVGLGRGGFRALRQAIQGSLGDQASERLLEAGHAAGRDVYQCFRRWLKATVGLDDPGAVAADALGPVLSDFFQALGWGPVSMNRIGKTGIAMDTAEWAEADPADNAPYPSCHFSAGLFAGFMGALSQQTVAVMEVECRSARHARCRFLLGKPEALEAVYQAMSEGRDYSSAL
jgi:predicted hydrocarbon binding protein